MANDKARPTEVALEVLQDTAQLEQPDDMEVFSKEDFDALDAHIHAGTQSTLPLTYEQTLQAIAAATVVASGGGWLLVSGKLALGLGAAGAATASGVFWQHRQEQKPNEVEMRPIGSPTSPRQG